MSTAMRGNWNYPTPIRFGAGRISELPDACRAMGMNSPLLVTDPGLAKLDIVARALEINRLGGLPTGLFAQVSANPVGADVDAGVAAYVAGGHDGVIAFGGGAALDVGKAVALMVGQTRPLWDFEDVADWYTRVNVAGMAPVVAVPTTSGTGSEVGRASVIVDDASGPLPVKKIIFHPRMLPGLVIADPELTVGLPAHITAAVGMDALSHNLEAYLSPVFHPLAEGVSIEGIRLVDRYLARAVADGADIEARAGMLAASTMGAAAFQKGLGAMHALSHPVGAVLHAHHGLTNAIVMPYVLEFNRAATADKMARLARLLDLADASAGGFIDWCLALRAQIGIPHTLQAVGMTEAHAAQLAPEALADPSGGTNPVPCTVEDYEALYLACVRG